MKFMYSMQGGYGMFITQIEQMKGSSSSSSSSERRQTRQPPPPPPQDQSLNCPRCKSTNTKFCYYNNYSLSQPRYLCKACRRYWTEGGSLRNVPVGGGSRREKPRPPPPSSNADNSAPSATPPTITTISPSSTPLMTKFLDLNPPLFPPQSQSDASSRVHGCGTHNDRNLSFPSRHGYLTPPHFVNQSNLRAGGGGGPSIEPHYSQANSHFFGPSPAMELLSSIGSSGMASSLDQREKRGMYEFDNFEVKPPALGFSTETSGVEGNGDGSLLFPFGEMKEMSEQQQKGSTRGWWNEVIGGQGSSW